MRISHTWPSLAGHRAGTVGQRLGEAIWIEGKEVANQKRIAA
jgi:hypothetical protein